MSKWLGFFVGLAIAITVVLTVVRPATPERETPSTDALPERTRALEVPRQLEPVSEEPDASLLQVDDEAQITGTPADIAEEITDVAEVSDDAPIPEPVAEPIPDFNWDAAPAADTETQIAALPEPDVTVVMQAPPAEPDSAPPSESAPLTMTAPSPVPASTPEPATALANPPAPVASATPPAATPPPVPGDVETVGDAAVRQWYAFWQPFGSELSAKGFSNRLERVTGLDYRVVKVESGEYHVAFGYDDEQSRLANLSTIEAATGLRLGGQSL